MSETSSNSCVQKIRDGVTIVSAITGLISALGAFIEEVSTRLPVITQASPLKLILVALLFAIVVLILQWNRLTRRSRLRDPDALILRPEEHLVGRDDDIRNVLELCNNEPLIWLVGESGAGKSAMLRAGVFPKLRDDPTKLPIYIDNWGADWIRGPQEALLDALRERLDAQACQQLKLNSSVGLDQTIALLTQVRETLRRLPILIFDQFNDYQTRHRSEFVLGRRRTLLTVEELADVNPFWQQIGILLSEGTLRCLFVSRADTGFGYGLDCVRFCQPQIYLLDRLAPGYALPLLEKLTAGSVIADPEYGFNRLQSRFCRDLESDGTILPIRMKVLFRSLVNLRENLTIRGYQKVGGLRGLEALYIQHHIAETARIVGMEQADVRAMLLTLTDQAEEKTFPLTDDQVLQALPSERQDKHKVALALNHLQNKEIVRKRLDPDKRSTVWLLDHDYLCQGISPELLAPRS